MLLGTVYTVGLGALEAASLAESPAITIAVTATPATTMRLTRLRRFIRPPVPLSRVSFEDGSGKRQLQPPLPLTGWYLDPRNPDSGLGDSLLRGHGSSLEVHRTIRNKAVPAGSSRPVPRSNGPM